MHGVPEQVQVADQMVDFAERFPRRVARIMEDDVAGHLCKLRINGKTLPALVDGPDVVAIQAEYVQDCLVGHRSGSTVGAEEFQHFSVQVLFAELGQVQDEHAGAEIRGWIELESTGCGPLRFTAWQRWVLCVCRGVLQKKSVVDLLPEQRYVFEPEEVDVGVYHLPHVLKH